MTVREREKERRDSLILVLLIILLGFLCIILSSGWALRFAPSWRLPANMGSNLNPDDVFLTRLPSNVIQPFDPGILTLPAWYDTFLTPGATFKTSTHPSPLTVTPFVPPTRTLTPVPTASRTATPTVFIPLPINTATRTATPIVGGPTPTSTATLTPSSTPFPLVDLQITKTDGVATYTAGSTVTYTIVVTNNGPGNVIGAVVSDPKPAQVTTWGWCVAPCAPVANSSATLSDIFNLTSGASRTYTVLANINPGASGNLVNTASVAVPAGYTDTNPGNNSATDTDFPALVADLQITKTDNATDYEAGGTTTYTIVVSNNGPSSVIGAVVSDTRPSNISTWSWACAGATGGASGCTPIGSSSSDFSDTIDLPVGSSITYAVTANISVSPAGPLTNIANVSVPAGYSDPTPGNNSDSDMDQLIVTDPAGNIGTTPDCPIPPPADPSSCAQIILAGTYVTLQFGTPLVVGGHPSWDLIYYELPAGINPGINMDAVILQLGDGSNWYTILNWGDGNPDDNTNISVPLLSNPSGTCAVEPDGCEIDASLLYNSTGVAIDLDGVIPNGTYYYIRIFAPSPDLDGQIEVDAIEVLP